MNFSVQKILWEKLYKTAETILCSAPGCHDFAHTLRVLKNARLLLKTEPGADAFTVEVAALLHDIARPDELVESGKCCHAKLGAQKAVQILHELGCTDEAFIQHVSDCVRTHRYRGKDAPVTLEAKIVYDADKLDSVGAIGIARAFHFAGRIGAAIHNTEETALNSESYSDQDSAYREYLVKLRHLHQKMLTKSGKILAEDRDIFMREFFDQLNKETF